MDRIAVVTGANRGIGLEVAGELARRGFAVLLTARDAAAGERAAGRLRDEGLDVRARVLDVADQDSIEAFARGVVDDPGRLDVLVNNAGYLYPAGAAVTTTRDEARAALEVNALGPWALTVALAPLLRRSPAGRVVNVSSEAGSLASMTDGHAPYAVVQGGAERC